MSFDKLFVNTFVEVTLKPAEQRQHPRFEASHHRNYDLIVVMFCVSMPAVTKQNMFNFQIETCAVSQRSASTQSLPLRQGSYRDAVLRSDEKQTISRADSRPTPVFAYTSRIRKHGLAQWNRQRNFTTSHTNQRSHEADPSWC